jgi:hypothetical protein
VCSSSRSFWLPLLHSSESELCRLHNTLNSTDSHGRAIGALLVTAKASRGPDMSFSVPVSFTCCDSSFPSQQYSNTQPATITYVTSACDTSVGSPQLCGMKYTCFLDYSLMYSTCLISPSFSVVLKYLHFATFSQSEKAGFTIQYLWQCTSFALSRAM